MCQSLLLTRLQILREREMAAVCIYKNHRANEKNVFNL